MSLGRRKVRLDDASAWVFNKMADVYDARPAYPDDLVEAIAALAKDVGGAVADVGAGIGHLALPLAHKGVEVVAIEPALSMLDRLATAVALRGLSVRTVHAAAESLPLPSGSLGTAVVVDALHFLDRELAGLELGRVLAPHAALALVTSEFGDTPFMRAVDDIMKEEAPRRPRAIGQALSQMSTLTRIPLTGERRFHDEKAVDAALLDRILRSISFIGPAMKPDRMDRFRQRVGALPFAPVWARTFTLRFGKRGRPPRVRRPARV